MERKNTPGRVKRILIILLLLGPAFILILISTRNCSHNFKELDDFGLAENYAFVDAQGLKYTAEDFKEYSVLINVLQPTCPENCSVSFWHLNHLIYQKMRDNSGKEGSLRIISFVTDGKGNQIKDLSAVSDMLKDQVEGYDPNIWLVASGDPKKLYNFEHNDANLLQKGEEYYGGEAFQELMMLLDKNNHLRMVLSGKSEGMIRRMREHVALLKKQYDKENAESHKNK
jgi:cytochrome oxidase Cu insertion factor (SCO1/SenC/PrrC family)